MPILHNRAIEITNQTTYMCSVYIVRTYLCVLIRTNFNWINLNLSNVDVAWEFGEWNWHFVFKMCQIVAGYYLPLLYLSSKQWRICVWFFSRIKAFDQFYIVPAKTLYIYFMQSGVCSMNDNKIDDLKFIANIHAFTFRSNLLFLFLFGKTISEFLIHLIGLIDI